MKKPVKVAKVAKPAPVVDTKAATRLWRGGNHRAAVSLLIAAGAYYDVLADVIPEDAALIAETYMQVKNNG